MARTADRTDIPNRLLAAGYLLFSQQGYNATGVQQIAEQAGVPKGSFYNHFDSKEAFAVQIVRHYEAAMEKAWADALNDAPSDPLAALHHLFAHFVRHHEAAACPGCLVGNFAAEVSESSPACRAVLGAVMRQWRERLAHMIERGQQAGQIRQDVDAATLAGFFWDAWQGALLRMKVAHSSRPLKEAVQLMLDRFFRP